MDNSIPDHLSYSSLHLLACPYAFWLKYDHGMVGPTTPWLALGSALHHSLEITHNDGLFNLRNAVTNFKDKYKGIIEDDDVFIGYPQMRKLENEGIEMLERYDAQIKSGQISDHPLAMEAAFAIPIAGTSLVGKIDRLDIDDDGEYTVTDYKSGKKKPEAFDLRNNLQFTSYAWAVKIMKGKLPKKLVWHHLRTGELLETERNEQDIKNLMAMIENAVFLKVNGVKHRIFHEGVCGWCDFKGPDICTNYELEAKLLAKV